MVSLRKKRCREAVYLLIIKVTVTFKVTVTYAKGKQMDFKLTIFSDYI